MDKKPLITVVIPVYNKASYLRECLDSVLTQSYKNIEVICIDDESTDNSFSTLENYAKNDDRVHLYKAKHQGASEIRNIGIKNTHGDYIHFLDADDLIKPGTYKKIVDFLSNSNKNIELISFFHDVINNENEVTNQVHKNTIFSTHYNEKQNIILSFLESPQEFMVYGGGFTVNNKLMKTSTIKENNLSFDKNIFSEDNDFCFSFLLHCKYIMMMPDDFYIYRIIPDSLSSKKQNKYDIYNLMLKTFYKLQNSYIKLGEAVYLAFCDAMINCTFFEYRRTSNSEIRLKNINEILKFKAEIAKNKKCLAVINKYHNDFNLIEYNRSSLISNINYEQAYKDTNAELSGLKTRYEETAKDLKKYIEMYNKELTARINFENKYNSIINSKTYKFGLKLSAPYRKFKKILKKRKD